MRWPRLWRRADSPGADPARPADPGSGAPARSLPTESTAGWAFLPPLQRTVAPVELTSRPLEFLGDLPTRAPLRFTGPLAHVVDARAPSGVVDGDGGGVPAATPVQRASDVDLTLLPLTAPAQPRTGVATADLDSGPADVSFAPPEPPPLPAPGPVVARTPSTASAPSLPAPPTTASGPGEPRPVPDGAWRDDAATYVPLPLPPSAPAVPDRPSTPAPRTPVAPTLAPGDAATPSSPRTPVVQRRPGLGAPVRGLGTRDATGPQAPHVPPGADDAPPASDLAPAPPAAPPGPAHGLPSTAPGTTSPVPRPTGPPTPLVQRSVHGDAPAATPDPAAARGLDLVLPRRGSGASAPTAPAEPVSDAVAADAPHQAGAAPAAPAALAAPEAADTGVRDTSAPAVVTVDLAAGPTSTTDVPTSQRLVARPAAGTTPPPPDGSAAPGGSSAAPTTMPVVARRVAPATDRAGDTGVAPDDTLPSAAPPQVATARAAHDPATPVVAPATARGAPLPVSPPEPTVQRTPPPAATDHVSAPSRDAAVSPGADTSGTAADTGQPLVTPDPPAPAAPGPDLALAASTAGAAVVARLSAGTGRPPSLPAPHGPTTRPADPADTTPAPPADPVAAPPRLGPLLGGGHVALTVAAATSVLGARPGPRTAVVQRLERSPAPGRASSAAPPRAATPATTVAQRAVGRTTGPDAPTHQPTTGGDPALVPGSVTSSLAAVAPIPPDGSTPVVLDQTPLAAGAALLATAAAAGSARASAAWPAAVQRSTYRSGAAPLGRAPATGQHVSSGPRASATTLMPVAPPTPPAAPPWPGPTTAAVTPDAPSVEAAPPALAVLPVLQRTETAPAPSPTTTDIAAAEEPSEASVATPNGPPTTTAAPGATAPGAAAAASPFAAVTAADLDELAGRLTVPLLRRVRGQLLVDRERRGTRTDL